VGRQASPAQPEPGRQTQNLLKEIITVSGREVAQEAPKQLKLARQEEFEPGKARHARKGKKAFHKEDRRYRREREMHGRGRRHSTKRTGGTGGKGKYIEYC
jgi:hypothetical protein